MRTNPQKWFKSLAKDVMHETVTAHQFTAGIFMLRLNTAGNIVLWGCSQQQHIFYAALRVVPHSAHTDTRGPAQLHANYTQRKKCWISILKTHVKKWSVQGAAHMDRQVRRAQLIVEDIEEQEW